MRYLCLAWSKFFLYGTLLTLLMQYHHVVHWKLSLSQTCMGGQQLTVNTRPGWHLISLGETSLDAIRTNWVLSSKYWLWLTNAGQMLLLMFGHHIGACICGRITPGGARMEPLSFSPTLWMNGTLHVILHSALHSHNNWSCHLLLTVD